MNEIKALQLDIRGTNPDNLFLGEKINLTDKTCQWVIPNGSPFFGEASSVKVRNQAGALLILNKDYWIEEEFPPLCKASGRRVCCFIRLSSEVLTNNTHITVDYRSLGAHFVPRNSLQEWVNTMQHGKIPVDWSKVFGVPPTLPPELHLQNIKTEIGDWYELTYFFAHLANIISTKGTTRNQEVTNAVATAFNRLTTNKQAGYTAITGHDRNYSNTHGVTKTHLQLGNHPNYRTATLEEDVSGASETLLSTPEGVRTLAKLQAPDTSNIFENGVIPISKFGGDSFIPPNISGSFEALGGVYPTYGMFIENGPDELIALSSRWDGRVRGLYYSTVKINPNNSISANYTGYKYHHPIFDQYNASPYVLSRNDKSEVILVGDPTTNKYFIGLTNGSLDAKAHVYSIIDRDTLISQGSNMPPDWINNYSYTLKLGPYVYLFLSKPESGQRTLMDIWRFNVADIGKPTPILPILLSDLKYTSPEGVAYNNVNFFRWCVPTTNKVYHNLDGSKGTCIFNYIPSGFSVPVDENAGKYLVKFTHNLNITGTGINGPVQGYTLVEVVYEWNINTNTLTLKNKTPTITIDFDNPNWNHSLPPLALNNYHPMPGYYLMKNGKIATTYTGSGTPKNFYLEWYPDVTTQKDNVENIWTELAYRNQRGVTEVAAPPFKIGLYPNSLVYAPGGEFFVAGGDASAYTRRNLLFREVTGGYINRPNISLINLPGILSRPLTNNVREVNLNFGTPMAGVCVPSAQAATYGVEIGDSEFCMGVQRSKLITGLPHTANDNDILIVSSHTKTLNGDGLYEITPTSDILYPEAIVEQLKQRAEFPQFFPLSGEVLVTITDPSGRLTTKFGWLPVIVTIVYSAGDVNKTLHSTILTINPTYSVSGSRRTVTGFSVIGIYHSTHVGYARNYSGGKWNGSFAGKPGNNIGFGSSLHAARTFYYVDGENIKVGLSSSVISTYNSTVCPQYQLEVTNRAVNQAPVSFSCIPYGPLGTYAMSPLGIAINDEVTRTSGPFVNSITIGGVSHLLVSSFPEVSWTIFFPANVTAVINGTKYVMEAGSIDLRDVSPNPANKTFYVYVTLENGKPVYSISETKLRISNSMMHVATVTTGTNQISTIERFQPFMIANFEMSAERKGGIIPVSTGLPHDNGDFRIVTYEELN